MKILLGIIIAATTINVLFIFLSLGMSFGFIPDDPAIITDAQKLASAKQGRLNVVIINCVLWATALLFICKAFITQRKCSKKDKTDNF